MSKKMLIDATHPEETRVVVVEGNKVDEFDFESLNKRQLAGNIYLAKVTRVEPSLQAAFVDYGGNRHGFLAFNEIHPDYYQIPVADREKLIAEEAAYAKATADEEARRAEQPKSKSRTVKKTTKANSEGSASEADAVVTSDVVKDDVIDGDVIDVDATQSDLVDVPENTGADAVEPAPEVKPDDAESTPQGEDTKAKDDAKEVEAKSDEAPASTDEDAPQVTPEEDDVVVEKVKAGIDTVGDDDVSEEVRPRKPRMKRYKIQEVVKVRQILLVQVVKEERGNKGAALTTYLSLAGRYCVLMPNTARGGGISRKITNASDRKKIKAIANKLVVPEGAGLIIRTAGASRNETDINRDYEFLARQWEQIRELTLKSIAPAPIYEEGNLIKRSIRDLYTRDIDEIHVEGNRGYEAAREYMKMFMPNRVDKVKLYKEQMPLFSRYQVESHLGAMFNPVVQLKSGGYLVIGITEALVAVDVNSGKATKESSIENTALKTNLEAAEEVARQMRLRDLAGLIVIDFIDMEERRNNTAVEKRLKDKLKNDRARIQVGRISGFGLLEMSRQRLRPGMLEATTQECPHCHGTGLLRSDDSMALSILRELEEEGVRKRSREVLVKAPINVANYLLNEKRGHIATIETRYGLSVRIEADVALIGTEYTVEKFKTATRFIPQPENAPVSMENVSMDNMPAAPATNTDSEGEQYKKKPRRRRGGRGRGKSKYQTDTADTNEASTDNGTQSEAAPAANDTKPTAEKTEEPVKSAAASTDVEPAKTSKAKPATAKTSTAATKKPSTAKPKTTAAKPKTSTKTEKTTPSTAKKPAAKKPVAKKTTATKTTAAKSTTAKKTTSTTAAKTTAAKKPATKTTAAKTTAAKTTASKTTATKATTSKTTAPKSTAAKTPAKPKTAKVESDASVKTTPAAKTETPAAPAADPKPTDDKPKRRGWWSRG